MISIGSFKVLWLYVSWLNQVLASFTFLTIAHYLKHRPGASSWTWLISFLPGVFMCAVSACFILIDKGNGFGMDAGTGYAIGMTFTAFVAVAFLIYNRRRC